MPRIARYAARLNCRHRFGAIGWAAWLLAITFQGSLEAAPPNILVILADDMGYGDLGCMGSRKLQTPHLDRLASSGVLCTQAYVASAVCSPSRAGLLTGRDPRRFGYEGNLNKNASSYAARPDLLGLPVGEFTLGDHLRPAGYSTALIGKWHQGTGPEFHPQRRGFDYFCGMLGGSHSYFPDPEQNRLERNAAPLREFSSPYLTDFFTDEALAWLAARQRDSRQPWFLFLSYNAPHGPMHARDEDLSQFSDIQDQKRRIYAAMMFALDRGVGRVVDFLETSGSRDNTLIVFFSDNGGATGNASWNGRLAGVKGCLLEGGVRVPMIWSWPRKLPAGTRYEGVVSSLDLVPTLTAAAGIKPLPLSPPRAHEDRNNRRRMVAHVGEYDGMDVVPSLAGEVPPPERRLFWRLQGQAAILNGQDKLIRLAHRPAQMFRPATDPGEQRDLALTQTSRYRELYRQLGEWENMLPTVPLWDSSPYWWGQSATHYDQWQPRGEPQ